GSQLRKLRPPRQAASLAPFAQTTTDVVRVDLERVADVLEREEPASVAGQHPFTGFVEHLRAARIPRVRKLLVAVDGVFEDREHEQSLTLEATGTPERRKELCWEKNVWLEQRR